MIVGLLIIIAFLLLAMVAMLLLVAGAVHRVADTMHDIELDRRRRS